MQKKLNLCINREMRYTETGEAFLVQQCFAPDGNEERGRIASEYCEYEMLEAKENRISYPIFSLQNGRSEIEFVSETVAKTILGEKFQSALSKAGW